MEIETHGVQLFSTSRIKGSKNIVADSMSRLSGGDCYLVNEKETKVVASIRAID